MSTYKNLLICLDLTEMDSVLLRYARFLVQELPEVEHVYFMHNIRFDFPEEAKALMAELDQPLPDLIREELEEQVLLNFLSGQEDAPGWDILIENGESTAHTIADVVDKYDTQLTLFGKKLTYRGSGQVPEKLLRQPKFKCDLLILPETAPHRLSKILVPIDFSKASQRALNKAWKLAQTEGASIVSQHVYYVPNHYFPFIPVQGFRKSIESDARREYERYKKNLPRELQAVGCEFTYARDRTRAQTIYDFAISRNKDLIVMGSRGRNPIPTVLLGSTALQVLQFDFHIPILVVR